jgi:hypothetical protein
MKNELARHIIKKGFTYSVEVEPVIMRESIKLDDLVNSIYEYLTGGNSEGSTKVS